MAVEDMLSVIIAQNRLIMRAVVESGDISKASYRAIAKEWNELIDEIKEEM